MSQPPTAPPPPLTPPPGKPRQSAWWFAPGAVSLLLALGCAAAAVMLILPIFQPEGRVPADAARHTVHLRDPGKHLLFAPEGADIPRCQVLAEGAVLPLRPDHSTEIGDSTFANWGSFASFTSPTPTVQVVCVSDQTVAVRVFEAVGTARVAAIVATVIGTVGLGLGGLGWLLVTAILFFSRPRRTSPG